MDQLRSKGSKNTPGILFDADEGFMEINGYSNPDNPEEIYTPILNWLNTYAKNPAGLTSFHFKMIYYNTASSKFFLEVFYCLNRIFNSGHKVDIFWHCEEDDEDMIEEAEMFSGIIDIPVQIV